MKIINKTWNEFWGEFLLVTFHKENPAKWELIKKKAKWVWNNSDLRRNASVLDLACGNGMLDICLAELGTHVTAVDRIEPIIRIAQDKAKGKTVHFICSDIRDVTYPENSFDCILILETAGLLNKEDERKLVTNARRWLRNDGKMIVDCQRSGFALQNNWEKEFPDGVLKFESTFDPVNSILTMNPTMITKDNSTIQLHDPYSNDDYIGVKRYLYKEEELRNILESIGYKVSKIPHYWGDNYYALIGEK